MCSQRYVIASKARSRLNTHSREHATKRRIRWQEKRKLIRAGFCLWYKTSIDEWLGFRFCSHSTWLPMRSLTNDKHGETHRKFVFLFLFRRSLRVPTSTSSRRRLSLNAEHRIENVRFELECHPENSTKVCCEIQSHHRYVKCCTHLWISLDLSLYGLAISTSYFFSLFRFLRRLEFVKQPNQQIARWIGRLDAATSFGYFTQFIFNTTERRLQNAKTSPTQSQ